MPTLVDFHAYGQLWTILLILFSVGFFPLWILLTATWLLVGNFTEHKAVSNYLRLSVCSFTVGATALMFTQGTPYEVFALFKFPGQGNIVLSYAFVLSALWPAMQLSVQKLFSNKLN